LLNGGHEVLELFLYLFELGLQTVFRIFLLTIRERGAILRTRTTKGGKVYESDSRANEDTWD
jgi:hypothetical protein